MRRLFIDEIENMRDIGGYAVGNDKVVKTGKMIRSNIVINLQKSSLEKIKEMGIFTVIDLRSDKELEKQKSIFYNNEEFCYYHIAIEGDGRLPSKEEEILETYIEMIEGKEQIKEFFEILSENDGGILYYCNAGKDRTGVVTALILKLLGVDERDIEADYIASGIFLQDKLKRYAEDMHNEQLLNIIIPKKETICNLFKYIMETYKSMEGYLNSCGITEEKISKIKNKYVQKI